jgi:prepilin-type N-terminal cleavage/methylation domain-containing protein
MNGARGFSLAELLVVVALVAMTAAVAAPNLGESRRTFDLQRVTRQIAQDGLRCRMEALTSYRNVGLVFAEDHGRPYYTMVMDGDGDGISRADFLRGIDKAIGPKVWVEFLSGGTHLGVPPGWRVPDPGGRGVLPSAGLRLGLSNIISFSEQGHATACSVYFNDGIDRVLAVRIGSDWGRLRVLQWRRGWREWVEIRL